MSSCLKRLVFQHLGPVLPEVGRRITTVTIGYLLKVATANDLARVIRHEMGAGTSVIDYRMALRTGYILKNVKLWLWRCYDQKYSPSQARAAMARFGVDESEWPLAAMVMKGKLAAKLQKDLVDKGYKSHELDHYEELIESSLDEVRVPIAKFAYRKLRFIVQAGHMDLEDLESDLEIKGLLGMLMQYPKVESHLHLTNICKTTYHNTGMNLIQHYTSAGRATMRREADGTFTSLKVSLDAGDTAPDSGYLRTHNQSTDMHGNRYTEDEAVVDHADFMSANQILDRYTGKRHEFLRLLSGHFCEDFSAWLTRREEDTEAPISNDELLDKLLEDDLVGEYIDLAAEFIGVTSYKAHVLLSEVRNTL